MYILQISSKAYIKLEENSNDIVVVQEPERATKFDAIGDAMRAASRINEDWEEHIIRVKSL